MRVGKNDAQLGSWEHDDLRSYGQPENSGDVTVCYRKFLESVSLVE